jgi:hypothetical protein
MKICLSIVVYGENSRYYKSICKLIETLTYYKIDLIIFDNSFGILNKYVPGKFLKLTKIVVGNSYTSYPQIFLRYQLDYFKDYDIALIRDSDYVFTQREFDLICLWAKSKYNYLAIRDHIDQFDPIMCGSFSIKKASFNEFTNVLNSNLKLLKKILSKRAYRGDQIFFSKVLYKQIITKLLVLTTGNIFKGENYQLIAPSRLDSYVIGNYIQNIEIKSLDDLYFKPKIRYFWLYRILGYRTIRSTQLSIQKIIEKNYIYFLKLIVPIIKSNSKSK